MTAVGTIHVHWSGGEHDFCCAKVGTILAIEDACKAGIRIVHQRLIDDTWGLNDVREPIRLGLIGGGLKPERAAELVRLHVDCNPHGLAPSAVLAQAILNAVIIGVPDDPVGKGDAAGDKDHPSPTTTDASAAPQSTDLDLP